MSLDLNNPIIKEYYIALMDNIKSIQSIYPTFKMSQEQIEEMLSPERIEMHERAKKLPSAKEYKEKIDENALKFIPGGGVPDEFKGQYYYMANPGDGPDAEKYNKKLFQNINRDDAIGQLARQNYILESLNIAGKVDIELLKNNPTEKQLFEMSIAYEQTLAVLMETEHMLSQQDYFTIKDEQETEIQKIMNYTGLGNALRDYNDLVKSDLFLTMPFMYLSKEQYQGVIDNIFLFGSDDNVTVKNLQLINKMLTQKKFFEKDVKSLEKPKVFTSKDFNSVNMYKDGPKGFDARRRDLYTYCYELSLLEDVEGHEEISGIKASAKTILDILASCDYYPTEEQQKSIVDASYTLGALCKSVVDKPYPNNSKANLHINHMAGQYAEILGQFKDSAALKSLIEYQKNDDALFDSMEGYLDMLNICMTGDKKDLNISELKSITNNLKFACLEKVNNTPKNDKQTLYRLKAVGARIEAIENGLDGIDDPSRIKDAINASKEPINISRSDNVLLNFTKRLKNADHNHDKFMKIDNDYQLLCRMADSLIEYSEAFINKGPLSKKEIDQWVSAFGMFNSQIESVIEQNKVSLEIRGELERSLNVFKTFKDKFLDAYDNPDAGITYNDVVTDPSWMDGIFVDKFATADIQVKEPYQAEKQSFLENVKEYRESAKHLKPYCETHIRDMFGTGNMKEIGDRLLIVQDYIDTTRNDIDILGITKDLEELKDVLDLSKITEINENTLITYENWESIRAKLDPVRRISDDKLVNMPTKMANGIKALGEKLSLEPKNLHIFATEMQKLDSLGKSVLGTVTALNSFLKNRDKYLPDDENALGPLSEAVNTITSKVTQYINGSSKDLPTPEDYKKFNEGLSRASQWISVYNPKAEGSGVFADEFIAFPNYLRALKGCGIPEIAQGADAVMTQLADRYERIADGLNSEVLSVKSPDNKETILKIDALINTGNLSVQSEQKLRFACMAVNTPYREEIVDQTRKNLEILSKGFTPENAKKLKGGSLNHPDGKPKTFADIYKDLNSTMLVGELLKREYGKYKSLKNTKSEANYAIDERLAGIYKQNVKSNDIKAFGTYINEFINSPAVQNHINRAPNFSKKLFGMSNTDGIYEGLFLNTLSKETLEALTQNNRKSGLRTKANSTEYVAISDAIKEIRLQERIPSANIDYTKLYGALSNYLTSRDLNPGTDAGKERCYAAEKAFVGLGLKLLETKPEMRPQIESELKVACLRSSRVREMVSVSYGNADLSLFAQMVKDKLRKKDYPAAVKDPKKLNKLLKSQNEFFAEPSGEEAEFRKLYAQLRPFTVGNTNARSMQEAREVFMSEEFRTQRKLGMDFVNKSESFRKKYTEYSMLVTEGGMSRAASYLIKTDGSPESEEYNKMLVEIAGTRVAAQIYGRHVVSQLKNISLSSFYAGDDGKLSGLAEHGMGGQLSFVFGSILDSSRLVTVDPVMEDFVRYNKSAYEAGGSLSNDAYYAASGLDLVLKGNMDEKTYLDNETRTYKYLNSEQREVQRLISQKITEPDGAKKKRSIDILQKRGFFDENLKYMKAFRVGEDGTRTRIPLDDAISGYSESGNIVFEKMNRRERNALDLAFERSVNLAPKEMREMPLGKDFKAYISDCYNTLKKISLDTCPIKKEIEDLTRKLSNAKLDAGENTDALKARRILRELRPQISDLIKTVSTNVIDADTDKLNVTLIKMKAQFGEFIASVTMKEFARKYPQPTVYEMNPDGVEAVEVFEEGYTDRFNNSIRKLKESFKDYKPKEKNSERDRNIKFALANAIISERYLEALENAPDNAKFETLDKFFGDDNYRSDFFRYLKNNNFDALVKSLDENEISRLSKGEVDRKFLSKLAERNEELRVKMSKENNLKGTDTEELDKIKKYAEAQKKIDIAKIKHAEEVQSKFNKEKEKLPKTKEEAINYLTAVQHKMQKKLGFHFANIRYKEIGYKEFDLKYDYMKEDKRPEHRQSSFMNEIRSALIGAMVCRDNIMALKENVGKMEEEDIQKLCSEVMREEKRRAFAESGAMKKLLNTEHGITAEQYMGFSIGADGKKPSEKSITNADNALSDVTVKFKEASVHWEKSDDIVNEYRNSGKAKVQAEERSASFHAEEKATAEMQKAFAMVNNSYKHALEEAASLVGIERNPKPVKPEVNPNQPKNAPNQIKGIEKKPNAASNQPKKTPAQIHKEFIGNLLRANYYSNLYEKRFDMSLDELKTKLNDKDAVNKYATGNFKAMEDFIKAQPNGQFEKNLKEMNNEQFRRYIRDGFKEKVAPEKTEVNAQGPVK